MESVALDAITMMDLGMPKFPNTPRLKVNGCGNGTVLTAHANEPNVMPNNRVRIDDRSAPLG